MEVSFLKLCHRIQGYSHLPEKWNFHEIFWKKENWTKKQSIFDKTQGLTAKLKEWDPPLKFNFTICPTSPNPKTSILNYSSDANKIHQKLLTTLYINNTHKNEVLQWLFDHLLDISRWCLVAGFVLQNAAPCCCCVVAVDVDCWCQACTIYWKLRSGRWAGPAPALQWLYSLVTAAGLLIIITTTGVSWWLW